MTYPDPDYGQLLSSLLFWAVGALVGLALIAVIVIRDQRADAAATRKDRL